MRPFSAILGLIIVDNHSAPLPPLSFSFRECWWFWAREFQCTTVTRNHALMRTGSATRYFCIICVAHQLFRSYRSSSFNSWPPFCHSAVCKTLKGERSASNAVSPSQVLFDGDYLIDYKRELKSSCVYFSPQKLSWSCPCCREICPWVFRRRGLKACCPCRHLSTLVLLLSSQDSRHSRRMWPMTVKSSSFLQYLRINVFCYG